ncbi:hypothetical protein EVJ58_g2486 [Rhodofomes roseus]|uniref:Uncharacterized protein n=1 Tax=Rhodofomes roseus TaxID=34475 RepID=A0A4Y9YSG4_9APHY|nr:hypothetical protein EVJ58_g2486 [Rhodofomes roseus]
MTHVWRLPSPTLMVRAIHPASRLAFFSYSDTLVLLQWDCGKVWQLRTIDQVVDEEIWTGITDANTFAPQPGLPKCSVFDTDMPCEHIPIRASSHFFGLTFRGVSMSEAQITPGGRHAETRVRISFLAYDILRGLFHYRVSVLLPPTAATDGIMHDEPPPHMSVRLLAVHRLAQLYATTGEAATNVPRSRSGFTPGSRGFVSACFMGRTGKRGVWIERRRGSMQRNVIAFSTALDALGEEDAADDGLENTPGGRTGGQSDSETDQQDWTLHSEARPIDGRVIYEVNSYDLRDDITRCAFAEAMGTVILGNRKGDLKLL